MSDAEWWSQLRGDPSRFLLSDDEPGVAWRTLVELLGRPGDSPAVTRARLAARELGRAAELLATQSTLGYWGSPSRYGGHWTGSAWHIVALAQLGADAEDARAARGAATLIERLLPHSGGFAVVPERPPSPCFTAELCAALTRLGFGHHPRVREAIAWLAERAGRGQLGSCPDLRHHVEGACPVAAVAGLRLVGELAPGERGRLAVLRQAGGDSLAALLGRGSTPERWWRFSHPCLGRTDALDVAYSLARVAWPAGEVTAALARGILVRQDGEGRWWSGRRAPFGEDEPHPSRWLTLKALVVLAAYPPEGEVE